MAADDLSAPLGQSVPKKKRPALLAGLPFVVMGIFGASLAVFVVWAAVFHDPFGGEPIITVAADTTSAPADDPAGPDKKGTARRYDGPAPETMAPIKADRGDAPVNGKTINIIDGTSGERKQVVVPGPADDKGPAGDNSAPAKAALNGDSGLIEITRHGAIPKIGADGARPSDVYAQPPKAALEKPDAPRIAIVLSGLGIGTRNTADAISKLPGAVTLGFAPYGADLVATVKRARDAGHEILLQVPMEPFDYPDNDPGPQTLLTSLGANENIDRLQWLMSRFEGYVGVVNDRGARFTASEPALNPVLREAGKRGLLYLDDGSSPRSLAGQIAGANNLPFGKADVTLDTVPTAEEIDHGLTRLEKLARENGVAIGIAHTIPVSIAHIAKWAKEAERRGFVLVPFSNATRKAKSS